MPSSKGSAQPKDPTCISMSPAPGRWFSTTSATWEALSRSEERANLNLLSFQVMLMGDHSLRTTGIKQNNKNIRPGSERTGENSIPVTQKLYELGKSLHVYELHSLHH